MEVLKVFVLVVALLSPAPSIADSNICFCPSPPSPFASLDGGPDLVPVGRRLAGGWPAAGGLIQAPGPRPGPKVERVAFPAGSRW